MTSSMRAKEGSSDYRYFPEPDLLPIEVSDEWRDEIAATLPSSCPMKARYVVWASIPTPLTRWFLAPSDSETCWPMRWMREPMPRVVANWLTGEVTAFTRREDALRRRGAHGEHLAELAGLTSDGAISATAAKEVSAESWPEKGPNCRLRKPET